MMGKELDPRWDEMKKTKKPKETTNITLDKRKKLPKNSVSQLIDKNKITFNDVNVNDKIFS